MIKAYNCYIASPLVRQSEMFYKSFINCIGITPNTISLLLGSQLCVSGIFKVLAPTALKANPLFSYFSKKFLLDKAGDWLTPKFVEKSSIFVRKIC